MKIVIACDTEKQKTFLMLNGRAYADGITKVNFKHEGGENPDLSVSIDSCGLPILPEMDINKFKEFLNDLMKGD